MDHDVLPPLRPLSASERQLIELVRRGGGVARVDLAAGAGLTGASVTRLVGGLIDMGIFDEQVEHQGRQGQPKRLLSLRAGSVFAAGISFSLSRMDMVVIDLTGQTLARQSLNIEGRNARAVADCAAEALSALLDRHNVPRHRFCGVGCAIPGNFGTFSTLIRAHEFFLDFDDDRAMQAFSDAFDVPVFMENDGAAAALGEYLWGYQSDDGASLFLIHIGHGLGGGAVIDGRPFRGAHGNACLPGVLFPYGTPRPTGQDLMQVLQDGGQSIADFDALRDLTTAGRAILSGWINRAGRQLGQAARVVTGLIDPTVIVVGGRLPGPVNTALVAAALSEPLPGPSRRLTIPPLRASVLGPAGGALGAAGVPLAAQVFG